MSDGSAGKYQISAPHARGVVIGERNLVVQHFTSGLSGLANDYSVRVANFLSEYLGSVEHPVPFGGRAAELSELEHWLAGAAASPYLLLAAPAGRGKSALLVQLLRRLQASEAVDVAFVPVSIRFRTNLAAVVFATLAARIATLYGREVPAVFGASAEEWRGVMSGYLGEPAPPGRQLVLIVDGLDEAADWEAGPDLFPFEPPPGIRVIASARFLAGDADASAWLERLGWQRSGLARTLTLGPLDRTGVRDLLSQAGLADADGGLADELDRLTSGDPLLLRLYLESDELSVRSLSAVPPGLDGYFKRWWEEQCRLWGSQAPLREPVVRAVLNLLAGALGPLTREELLELEPSLDTWSLSEVLRPLQRFVLGDGERQGFVYSHPRLAEYFFKNLTAAERRAVEERFVQWGANAVRRLPGGIPAYVAQHFSTHLSRAGRRAELLALVRNPAWYTAQQTADPSGATFLGDTRLAWSATEAADARAPSLGDEVLCALTAASQRSFSGNFPAAVLLALVETGRWSPQQALQVASHNPDGAASVEAIAALVPSLPVEADRLAALRQALDAVRSLANSGPFPLRSVALAELLPHLPPALAGEALAIARTTLAGEEKVSAIARLLPGLPADCQQPALDSALAAARALPEADASGRNPRARELVDLAARVPGDARAAVAREALAHARRAEGHGRRAEMLARLVPYLPEPARSEAIREAFAAVSLEDSGPEQAAALAALAGSVRDGEIDDVLHAVDQLRWVPGRAMVFDVLAPRLPAEPVSAAIAAVGTQEPSFQGFRGLVTLVARLAEVGDPSAAATAARRLPPGWCRDEALGAVGPHLAERVTAEEGLAVARGIEGKASRVRALSALVRVLPEPHRTAAIDEATAVAEALARDPLALAGDGQDAVVEMAVDLARGGDGRKALGLVLQLPERDQHGGRTRLEALAKLLPALAGRSRDEALDAAMTAARSVGDDLEQALALARLGSLLEAGERAETQAAAVALASSIAAEGRRGEILATLFPLVDEALRPGIIAAAIPVLRGGRHEIGWRRLFDVVLPHLTQPDMARLLGLSAGVTQDDVLAWSLELIGPRLPDSMVPAVLDRVEHLVDPESRLKASVALLSRLAPAARRERVRRLLDQVAELSAMDLYHQSPRAGALADIAPFVDEATLDPVAAIVWSLDTEETEFGHMLALAAIAPRLAELGHAHEALDLVGAIDWDMHQGRALARVIPHLPASLLSAAGALLAGIDRSARKAAVVALASRLPDGTSRNLLAEAAIAVFTPAPWPGDDPPPAPSLLDRLTPADLREALALARMLERPELRARAIAGLASRLPERERDGLCREAVECARTAEEPQERAKALGALSRHAPEAMLREIFEAVVQTPQGAYRYDNSRSEALAVLAPRLAKLPAEDLYAAWRDALHLLASRSRRGLLADLGALTPVIHALGGVPAVRAVAGAVREITARWR